MSAELPLKRSPPPPLPRKRLLKITPFPLSQTSLQLPRERRGRPTGKRSDGEHIQVTAYIRRETHHAVKVALLQGGKGKEFSELVQELLAKWLKSRT